jgi:hypothetical protein
MDVRFSRLARAALLAGAGALAGCTSAMPDFSQFKVPTTRSFLPENMDTYAAPASVRSDQPVSPGDLVDAQGICAGGPSTVAAAPVAPAPPPAASEPAEPALSSPAAAPGAATAPPVLGTVGLDMTECEVVRAIGTPQSVNISTGQRGERRVTMVYMGSERAGTYLFRNGRLNSLERGPEPPPPRKVERPKKKRPVVKKKPKPQQPPAT